MLSHRISLSLIFSVLLLLAHPAGATDRFKANNTTALNAVGSWAGASVPVTADRAMWDTSTTGLSSTTVSTTNSLGASMTWGQIRVNDGFNQTLVINGTAGAVLTLDQTGGVNSRSLDASGTTSSGRKVSFGQS